MKKPAVITDAAARIADLERALADALAQLADARAQLAAQKRPRPTLTCVNCGQGHTTIEREPDGRYRCPVCRYVWAEDENHTPFRQPRRR